MTPQLKQSLKRFLWTFLFSGASGLIVLLASLPQDKFLDVSWRALLAAFLSAAFMGVKKWADWRDFEEKPV